MTWTVVRGITCLAVVFSMAGFALAQDSDFQIARSGAGSESSQTSGALSNAGIDRLLDINAKHYSVLRSSHDSKDAADENFVRASTPLGTVEDAPITQGRGVYMLAGIGGALAMGLGLCFASMMSGRQRTINTFTAGFVRVR